MPIRSNDEAFFSNIRDLMEILADGKPSELIKKFLKLERLKKCLLRGALDEPELKQQLTTKRALAKGREKEQQKAAKRRKLSHGPAGETGENTDIDVEDYDDEGDETESYLGVADNIGDVDQDSSREDSNYQSMAPLTAGTPCGVDVGHNTVVPENHPASADAVKAINTNQANDKVRHGLSIVGTRTPSTTAVSDASNTQSLGYHAENNLPIAELPATPAASLMRTSITTTAELPALPYPPSCETNPHSTTESSSDETVGLAKVATSNDTGCAEFSVDGSTRSSENDPPLTIEPSSSKAIEVAKARTISTIETATALPNMVTDASLNQVVPTAREKNSAQEIINEILKKVWPTFAKRTSSNEKRDHDMNEILTMIERLNFWTVQYRITIFAEKRARSPGNTAKVSELPDGSDPVAVFHAIEAVSVAEYDAKLHRIFGQIRLVKAVKEKIDQGYKPKEALLLPGTMKIEYTKYFLQDMANSMTIGKPKNIQVKTWEKLRREHSAGRKWMQIIDTFRGEGAVFILLFADVSSHAFSHTYTNFQRAAMRFIFSKSPSLTRLAGCFGEDALDRFCRSGRLDDETTNKVRDCEGPATGFVESEDGVDMD